MWKPQNIGAFIEIGKVLGSLFQAVTPRTAGANTLPVADLTQSTLFLTIFLMFIGAGPGSTAGGIKITTFVVFLSTVMVSKLQGKKMLSYLKSALS